MTMMSWSLWSARTKNTALLTGNVVQVLTTHVERIRRNEAASQQASSSDDEKIRQVGKSNLDKWLQVLLFKELDSAGSSPAQDSPLHRALSPALSQLSMAAMRGSMELEIARDQVALLYIDTPLSKASR